MGGRGGRAATGRIGWLGGAGGLATGGADDEGTIMDCWGGGGGRAGGSGGWMFLGGCGGGICMEPDVFGIAGPIFSFSSSGL